MTTTPPGSVTAQEVLSAIQISANRRIRKTRVYASATWDKPNPPELRKIFEAIHHAARTKQGFLEATEIYSPSHGTFN